MESKKALSYIKSKFRKLFPSHPEVAVVRLSGAIGQVSTFKQGLSMQALASVLQRAFELKKAKAVALIINSPGGSPVQSSLIGQRIRALSEEFKLPVYCFVEDVAASGGYWLACAADEIYADKASIIGSIGVVSAGFGFPELIKKYGIERRVYTAGKSKSLLDPFQAEKKDDINKIKKLQTVIHSEFIAWVKSRRTDKLKADDDTLFNGDVWCAEQAKQFGLIDEIGEIRSVMREKFGKKVNLKVIKDEAPWWKIGPKFGMKVNVSTENLAEDLLSSLEHRSLWQKYGL